MKNIHCSLLATFPALWFMGHSGLQIAGTPSSALMTAATQARLAGAPAGTPATEGKMSSTIMERSAVAEECKWNLSELYPSQAAWEEDLKEIEAELKSFAGCRNRLGRSAKDLADCLARRSAAEKRLARLLTYASLFNDQDARVVEGQALEERSQKIRTNAETAFSFVEPEILKIAPNKLATFSRSERLKDYRHYLDNVTRRRAHILSAPEEEIVARAGDLATAPEAVYKTLSTVNLPFPEITLKSGEKVTLTQAMYTRFRTLPDRDDRGKVFQAFWSTYQKFKESFAAALSGVVSRDRFFSRARKYPGDLESSLDATNLPTSIYTNMIEQVRAGRPAFWRYLKLRKKVLGLPELSYSDLYASIVPSAALRFDLATAQQTILSALSPLGPDCAAIIRQAFSNRWADVYPTAGKRSGAYMNGSAYDVHPYVLLNFNDDYESMSTMAHEFGHALHSFFSNRHQPFVMADYPTFTAEVASTVNENLLRLHLYESERDWKKKLFLIGEYLENFRQTVFRQALFAEFELSIHQLAGKGEALTAEILNETYLKLLREYYGEAEGVLKIDPLYGVEWAYIPHLFWNFYMFQYTTSFVAASAIASRIKAGDAVARDRYLDMLKAGGSRYPLDLLRLGGVDMTEAEPYREALKTFERALDEVEKLTGK